MTVNLDTKELKTAVQQYLDREYKISVDSELITFSEDFGGSIVTSVTYTKGSDYWSDR